MAKGYKTGGRQKGTPNKEKPLKALLREHSLQYFAPNPDNPDGASDFAVDVAAMTPADRADAHLKILKFHTPQMQATAVDISASSETTPLMERLAALDNK